MDIMLTVSYSVKIPKDEFLNSENGYVKEEMRRQLERLFPEKIALTENTVAQREHLIHAPLCSSCAWELEADFKNEEFVKKLREKTKKNISRKLDLSPEIAYYLGDRRKERENYERF